MKKLFIFAAVLFGLYGCSSDESVISPESDMKHDKSAFTELRFTVIDTTRVIATETKAMDVADRFLAGSEIKARAAAEKTVTTIYQENGTPAMYVVNYGEDGGFVIISATKDTEPILAFSDTGSFSIDNIEESPAGMWLDEAKYYVEHSSSLPDSVKLGYAQQWASLTNTTVPASQLSSRGWSDPEEVVCRNQALEYYYNLGYEIIENPSSLYHGYSYTLCNALDNLSDVKEYDGFSEREKSFLMIKSIDNTQSVKPKTTTEWGQGYPYNFKLTKKYPKANKLGCVTVAVAQLMKYYAKPNGGVQYEKMPDDLYGNYGGTDETLCDFLLFIGESLGIKYDNGESGSSYKDGAKLLNKYGFPNATYKDYNFHSIKYEIQKGPIGLRAETKDGKGHVWVCDGYYFTSTDIEYLLVTYNGNYMDATPAACLTPVYTECGSSGHYAMHMNWGWGGNQNGYFRENWEVDIYNFYKERKAIIGLN